ncbi:MAG: NrfD/PsrC family molybdoenzyme membrane anchor subunit [Gemmatimonadales bacterium]
MSDTFFTSSPHWAWYIVWYFFVGGIAGCGFFIAALLHFFGRPEDRPVVRLGYYVACAGAVVSGALLTLDLNRPERFWHMLIQSNTGAPMFKSWSPMSVGAWVLLLFSGVALLAALGAAGEERWAGRLRVLTWRPVRALGRGVPAACLAAGGTVLGLFLAGYTGVLLTVTNRPLWADSNLLGALFLFSGASTAAATLILLSRWRGQSHPASLHWLARFDRGALSLELVALVAFVVSLGPVRGVLVGWWGLVLLVGVAGAGIITPLFLERRLHGPGAASMIRAAALVLVGGFLLRVALIFSSNEIHAVGAGVTGP